MCTKLRIRFKEGLAPYKPNNHSFFFKKKNKKRKREVSTVSKKKMAYIYLNLELLIFIAVFVEPEKGLFNIVVFMCNFMDPRVYVIASKPVINCCQSFGLMF